VAGGAFDNALVIGADTLSSITDYQDRESCVLFGDGAGALVIGPDSDTGRILDHVVGMDGEHADLIEVVAGGSREPSSHETVERRAHYLRMQGNKVFRFAVAKICELVAEMTARNGLTLDDIDLLVPHQANRRILEAARRTLGLAPERVLVNVDRYGNTSNASIPLALDEAARSGRLRPGMRVLLVAFGGGLTWGATLLRW
jgi:3-oxoacyl-[acyl-carrier-protein] synthase-3